MGKTRPPYPRQFREEAVRLVRESGKPLVRIAKDLGVSEPSLRTWVKQADLESGKRSDGLTTEEHARSVACAVRSGSCGKNARF